MAWTAPSDWNVGEVVVATKMNTHVRDNLKYLKGQAGTITLEDSILIQKASGSATLGIQIPANTTFGQFIFNDQAGSQAMYMGYIGSNAGFGARNDTVEVGAINKDITFRSGASGASEYMRLTAAGNFGIGTAAPQGKIHAVGAGGGFLFVSCNAVDGTLQTPVVAGTVTQSAAFWGYDRNNTGGAFIQVSGNMLALTQAFNLVNTDTVTVTVTAGGAITVQRTAGTSGTHQVNFMILYK